MDKRLVRSRKDRMIAGVCGGLGDYLEIDPLWIRLFFVLLLFATGSGLLLYLILWILIPEEGKVYTSPKEVLEEGVQEVAETARQAGEAIGTQLRLASAREEPSDRNVLLVGMVLIVLGIIFLLENLGFHWFSFRIWWPVILIAGGLALLLRRIR